MSNFIYFNIYILSNPSINIKDFKILASSWSFNVKNALKQDEFSKAALYLFTIIIINLCFFVLKDECYLYNQYKGGNQLETFPFFYAMFLVADFSKHFAFLTFLRLEMQISSLLNESKRKHQTHQRRWPKARGVRT